MHSSARTMLARNDSTTQKHGMLLLNYCSFSLNITSPEVYGSYGSIICESTYPTNSNRTIKASWSAAYFSYSSYALSIMIKLDAITILKWSGCWKTSRNNIHVHHLRTIVVYISWLLGSLWAHHITCPPVIINKENTIFSFRRKLMKFCT